MQTIRSDIEKAMQLRYGRSDQSKNQKPLQSFVTIAKVLKIKWRDVEDIVLCEMYWEIADNYLKLNKIERVFEDGLACADKDAAGSSGESALILGVAGDGSAPIAHHQN